MQKVFSEVMSVIFFETTPDEKPSDLQYWKPYSNSLAAYRAGVTVPLITADTSVISDASFKVGATREGVVKDYTSPYL